MKDKARNSKHTRKRDIHYVDPVISYATPPQVASAPHHGVAVAPENGEAKVGRFGVAYAGKGGKATGDQGAVAASETYCEIEAGELGVARGFDVARATVGDLGIAYVADRGRAKAGRQGVAVARDYSRKPASGQPYPHGAYSGQEGIAAVRYRGLAVAGKLGIAVGWNDNSGAGVFHPAPTDKPEVLLSAGEGGLLIAYGSDPATGQRKLVAAQVSSAAEHKPDRFYKLAVVGGELKFVETQLLSARKR
jgi:hypothetical protein